jgi:cytochrome c-type biogenesis protein CcmH
MSENEENSAALEANESPAEKKSRTGLIIFLAATALVAVAIGYRAFNPIISPEIAEANENAPLTIPELQARADADPLDAKAWQELAFAHFSAGGYERAARAYRQAIEGDPDNAVLWSALGESRVMASERDPMPPGAVSAFEKAIDLDPTDPRSRYFLGVQKDLQGDAAGAIADWTALLKETPPGAVWEDNLRRTIEQVGKINKIDTAPMLAKVDQERAASAPLAPRAAPALTAGNAIPGPSQEQIAAARAISPSDQQDMAEGMVERLDTRLRGQPSDVNGWVMLMRSRITLGQPDKAAQALKDAIAANPAQASRLRAEAAALQVP